MLSFEDSIRIMMLIAFGLMAATYAALRIYALGYRHGSGDVFKSVVRYHQERVRPGEHEPICDCPVPDHGPDRVCLSCFGFIVPRG